jgi:hypothetical protein
LVSLIIRLQLHTPNHRKRELRKTREKAEKNPGEKKKPRRAEKTTSRGTNRNKKEEDDRTRKAKTEE